MLLLLDTLDGDIGKPNNLLLEEIMMQERVCLKERLRNKMKKKRETEKKPKNKKNKALQPLALI